MNKFVISDQELQRISNFLSSEIGVHLATEERNTVENELHKRISALGLNNLGVYLDYTLGSTAGNLEKLELIDALINSETGFYHGLGCFDHLHDVATDNIQKNFQRGERNEFNVWSAGCSTGEEAYTISLELNEIADKDDSFSFSILATDVSHNYLSKASRGVYTEKQVKKIPVNLRDKYLEISNNGDSQEIKVGQDLRRKIKFKSHNLMDEIFFMKNKMDVIFCRNVMTGFSQDIQKKLLSKFEKSLTTGGYLVVGDSEALTDENSNFKKIAPMMYQINK